MRLYFGVLFKAENNSFFKVREIYQHPGEYLVDFSVISKRTNNFFSHPVQFKTLRLTLHSLDFVKLRFSKPASCSSGNAFVSGAEGLRFKLRAGQIE